MRIIPRHRMGSTELGLKQRIRALNMFIQDIYNGAKIIKDGVIPEDVVLQSVIIVKHVCMTPPHGAEATCSWL